MEFPSGFDAVSTEGKLRKLKKALYGFKQFQNDVIGEIC